ncbi:MAG TPA: MIP/aquaporin family protein [Frankiaceae bacterium]|nr:MIP/aquaporin family protein [Frankiaceae bacterium]
MSSVRARQAVAETVGTLLLVTAVVGSGIAAERLSPDPGVQLLVNAFATAGALVAVILAVGPVSGAHLNPAVSVADAALGGLRRSALATYLPAQVAGACLGAVLANVMFGEPAVALSRHARGGAGTLLAEAVATAGLLLVVFGVVRSGRATVAPFAVAAYIAGAYFFTSSTSFANPAVTVGRALSDTFAGIAPRSVPAFLAAQALGAAAGTALVRVLYPTVAAAAGDVVVPHPEEPR